MIKAAIVIVMAAVGGLSTSSASEVPFPDRVPNQFKVTYAHDLQGSISVELRDGELICRRDLPKRKTWIVNPGLADWTQFIKKINLAKVYKWEPSYVGQQFRQFSIPA